MGCLAIIFCVAIMIIVVNVFAPTNDKEDYKVLLTINSFLWIVTLICAVIAIKVCVPTALDVYRGNTELEIHSINGVPVDTVIIYKKK